MNPSNENAPSPGQRLQPPRYYFLCGVLAGVATVFVLLVALHFARAT